MSSINFADIRYYLTIDDRHGKVVKKNIREIIKAETMVI